MAVAAVVADRLPLPFQPQQAVTLLLSAPAALAAIRRVVINLVTAMTLPLWVIPDMVAVEAAITVWAALEVAEAVAVEEPTLIVVEVVALKAITEEAVALIVAAVAAAWEVLAPQTAVEEALHHGTGGLLVTEAMAFTIMAALALMLDRMPAEEAEPVGQALCVEELVIRGWCCFAINIKER